jgi:hypothetical protein
MKCNDCKHANWSLNKLGHLHPNKSGKCTLRKEVPVPPSMSTFGVRLNDKHKIVIEGGRIERGQELQRVCPYYERN